MKPTILIIDDKPEIAKVISMYLRSNFQTEYCSNGLLALERLRNSTLPLPDAIISDINMPDMDGYELLRQIKKDKSLAEIPVMVLSSVESSADRIKILNMGADDFMLKPFNPEELLIRLKHLLR